MIKNGDVARIREVYEISQRLESKIDTLDARISNIEGRSSMMAIVWSSFISIIGMTLAYLLKK